MPQLEQLALDPHAPLHPAHSRGTQAKLHEFKDGDASFEASTRQCCAAAPWAAQRVAASYRAMADFKEQEIVQVWGSAGSTGVAALPRVLAVLPRLLSLLKLCLAAVSSAHSCPAPPCAPAS